MRCESLFEGSHSNHRRVQRHDHRATNTPLCRTPSHDDKDVSAAFVTAYDAARKALSTTLAIQDYVQEATTVATEPAANSCRHNSPSQVVASDVRPNAPGVAVTPSPDLAQISQVFEVSGIRAASFPVRKDADHAEEVHR